jgi:hypothetical protein
VNNSGPKHNYAFDVRVVLLRRLANNRLRTELEIEIVYKWALANCLVDPTSVAFMIGTSKSRKFRVDIIQGIRLETYDPGEGVLFQGSLPRLEDGHFTILSGVAAVVMFQSSVKLLLLQEFTRARAWDDANFLLSEGDHIAELKAPSGFGELSTMSKAARTASITASQAGPLELIVMPKDMLLRVTEKLNGGVGSNSECIDYLRQTGLTNVIPTRDLLDMAKSMSKELYQLGDLIYTKGESCACVYLVIVGDVLMDTEDAVVRNGQPAPFYGSHAPQCYVLSGGSVLGDEGLVGNKRVFGSSAVVVSELASVFKVTGYGMRFFGERLGVERYTALAYRDAKCWGPTFGGEKEMLQSYFSTLRKAITNRYPGRGIFTDRAEMDESARKEYFHPELFKDKDGLSLATDQTVDMAAMAAQAEADSIAQEVEKKRKKRAANLKRKPGSKDVDDDDAGGKKKSLPRLMLHQALKIRGIILNGHGTIVQTKRLAKDSILREEYSTLRKEIVGRKGADVSDAKMNHHLDKSVETHLARMNQIPRDMAEEEAEEEHQAIVISMFSRLGSPTGGDDFLDDQGGADPNKATSATYSDTDSSDDERAADSRAGSPKSRTVRMAPCSNDHVPSPGPSVAEATAVTADTTTVTITGENVAATGSIDDSSATDSTVSAAASKSTASIFVVKAPRERKLVSMLLVTQVMSKVEAYVRLVHSAPMEKPKAEPLEPLDPKKTLALNLAKAGVSSSGGEVEVGGETHLVRRRTTMHPPVAKQVAVPKDDFVRSEAPKTRRIRPGLWKLAVDKPNSRALTADANDLADNAMLKRLRARAGYRGKDGGTASALYPVSFVNSFDTNTREGMGQMLTNTDHDYIRKRKEYVGRYNWNTRFMKLSDQAVVEPGFGLTEGDDQDQDPNQYQDHDRDGDGGEDQDQGYKYEHEPEHERDWEQDWKREEEAAAQQTLADEEVAAVTATDSADGAEASATPHEDKEQHDNLYHHNEGDEETLDSSTVATELSDLESKTSSGTKVVLASPLMKERPPEAKSEKEDKGNKVDKKGKMPNISALQRFHQTQAEESGQSAFQKGKKKVARVSRFRLYNEVPGDMFSSSQREEILAESGKTERNIAEMSDAQRRVACLEQIHGNLDMASWQLFSIKSCVDNNDGPKVTLPELGSRALSVLDVKQRKGRYGSRLVYLQGKNEGVFEKAPSYLDVSHRK